MKRIQTLIILLFTASILALFSAHSENCEHQWTYTNNGESGHSALCSLCSKTHSDAHNLTASYKEPTCLSPAVTSYECTLCGYIHTFTEGEKNPEHAWSEYAVVREATCRQAGLQSRTCPDCGQVDSIEIPQLEHDYDQWEQYDEKWHIRYCKACGWAYKGSHRLDDGEITLQPTESQLGVVKYTCRVCSDTFENIISVDGTIYDMEAKDVLSNGTNYLLAASRDEEVFILSEVCFPDGSRIDLRPDNESSLDVYASAATGAYAGISIESGHTAVDIVPNADHETISLEFLLLKNDTTAFLRIFNASGAIEIQNLNGPRVIIAQEKDPDGNIITLLMRITEKRDSVECEAQMLLSQSAMISISNKSGEYEFTLPENAVKTASLTFKYQRKSGKITVSPRNHENNPNGTSIYILEGIEFLRTAENTKTAETYVTLSDENGTWRLRATFPTGYTMETPLFYKDGSYACRTNRYLMDESSLGALMLIDPSPNTAQPETPEIKMPDVPSATQTLKPEAKPSPTPVPAPAPVPVSAEDAKLLIEDVNRFHAGETKAFTLSDHPSVVVQYAPGWFLVHQTDEAADWILSSVTLVQQDTAFRILNAYSFPAEFQVSHAGGTFSLRALMKNGEKIREVSLGTYVIEP